MSARPAPTRPGGSMPPLGPPLEFDDEPADFGAPLYAGASADRGDLDEDESADVGDDAPWLASSRGVGAGYAPLHGPRSPASGATSKGESSTIASTAYLAQLAQLARELAAQAAGRCDAAVIRLLRQRLTEWVEDVRSVGGNPALAGAVEAQVLRLSAALAAPPNLVAEATAIAVELAALAAGAPPPETPETPKTPGKKKSRLAFWK